VTDRRTDKHTDGIAIAIAVSDARQKRRVSILDADECYVDAGQISCGLQCDMTCMSG